MQHKRVHPELQCKHCGNLNPPGMKDYCCAGCQTVAEVIHARGWDRFYQLRKAAGAPAKPLQEVPDDFRYFATESYVKNHCIETQASLRFTWYLPQVHCAACLWLVHQVGTQFQGVHSLSCRLEDGRTEITTDPNCDLPALAQAFSNVGYSPTLHPFENQGPDPNLLRLGLSGALAANIMLFSVPFYFGLEEPGLSILFAWLAAGLSTLLVWIGGRPFFQHALLNFKNFSFHFDQPISIGIASAYGLSLYQLVMGQPHGMYFDSMAMLIFFLLLGRYLRSTVLRRARQASQKLLTDMPKMVLIWRQEKWQFFESEQIEIGDIIKLRAGDVLPADGQLLSDSATLNLQVVTGEARPTIAKAGDRLLAGSIILGGTIQVEASSQANNTTLAQFEGLAKELFQKRPGLKQARIAALFLGGVTTAAALGCILWWPESPQKALEIALTIFIVACPCALALAAPTAHAMALRHAAKLGIWVKNLRVFSVLPKIQTFVFDKTGVLTMGEPQVTEIRHFTFTPRLVEAMINQLETESDHPLSRAFHQAFTPRMSLPAARNVKVHSGLGISGLVDGRHLLIGGPHTLEGLQIPEEICLLAQTACASLPPTATHICVLLDHTLAAVIALEDATRPEAKPLFNFLRRQGIKTTILSGDHPLVVEAITHDLGANQGLGEQLPEEKLAYIKNCHPSPIAMMGDGLNDMGALAVAPLSLTHANASASALQFADIILAKPELTGLIYLWKLVRRANQAKRLGLIFSLGYNVFAVLLALMGLINPLIAAILMPLSSLSLVAMTYAFFPKEPRWGS